MNKCSDESLGDVLMDLGKVFEIWPASCMSLNQVFASLIRLVFLVSIICAILSKNPVGLLCGMVALLLLVVLAMALDKKLCAENYEDFQGPATSYDETYTPPPQPGLPANLGTAQPVNQIDNSFNSFMSAYGVSEDHQAPSSISQPSSQRAWMLGKDAPTPGFSQDWAVEPTVPETTRTAINPNPPKPDGYRYPFLSGFGCLNPFGKKKRGGLKGMSPGDLPSIKMFKRPTQINPAMNRQAGFGTDYDANQPLPLTAIGRGVRTGEWSSTPEEAYAPYSGEAHWFRGDTRLGADYVREGSNNLLSIPDAFLDRFQRSNNQRSFTTRNNSWIPGSNSQSVLRAQAMNDLPSSKLAALMPYSSSTLRMSSQGSVF